MDGIIPATNIFDIRVAGKDFKASIEICYSFQFGEDGSQELPIKTAKQDSVAGPFAKRRFQMVVEAFSHKLNCRTLIVLGSQRTAYNVSHFPFFLPECNHD